MYRVCRHSRCLHLHVVKEAVLTSTYLMVTPWMNQTKGIVYRLNDLPHSCFVIIVRRVERNARGSEISPLYHI